MQILNFHYTQIKFKYKISEILSTNYKCTIKIRNKVYIKRLKLITNKCHQILLFRSGVNYKKKNMNEIRKSFIIELNSLPSSIILRSKLKNQNSKKVSNYQIREKLGSGSFATVYKAIHIPTQQIVAVKVFTKAQMTPQEIDQVYAEVGIHKKLFHTNIVRIYQFHEDDEKIYIFMEYCQNGELFTLINENGPLSQTYSCKVFKYIMSALKYMKSQRVFHRDIKCQNILFDKNWNVKLVDFSFATNQQFGSFSQTFCGSPSFTAPEMLNNETYKAQMIDVWCLGVTLYAMLTGNLPFDGKTPSNTRQNIKYFKYQTKKYFSNQVKQIFNQIFVQDTLRSSIEQIQGTEYWINGAATRSNFLNSNTDEMCLDYEILKKIKNQHNVESVKIIQSIKQFKADQNSALYYLLVKKQILRGNKISSDIGSCNFVKRKKRSSTLRSIKLDQIIDKKQILQNKMCESTKRRMTIKRENFIIRPSCGSVDMKSYRTKSRNFIQDDPSSKIILDRLQACRRSNIFE